MPDAYIKVDGIDGSSMDSEHKKWIEIVAYSHSIIQPINASMAGRRAEGRAQWGDFIIIKEKDRASPLLAHACAAGNHIPKVEVELMAAGAAGTNKRNRYMRFQLQDVYVSSFKSGNSGSATVGGNAQRPTEEVCLNFGKIKWEFTPDLTAKAESPVIKGWDRDKNEDAS